MVIEQVGPASRAGDRDPDRKGPRCRSPGGSRPWRPQAGQRDSHGQGVAKIVDFVFRGPPTRRATPRSRPIRCNVAGRRPHGRNGRLRRPFQTRWTAVRGGRRRFAARPPTWPPNRPAGRRRRWPATYSPCADYLRDAHRPAAHPDRSILETLPRFRPKTSARVAARVEPPYRELLASMLGARRRRAARDRRSARAAAGLCRPIGPVRLSELA